MIELQTHPGANRHWRLDNKGAIATLAFDVDEATGLMPGYVLKMNSYDLGVDIELYDAVQRLRFEHPAVRVVVITSAKDRLFSAYGANFAFAAPHHAFNRRIGVFAGNDALPDGTLVDREVWEAQRANILPTPGDYESLRSLMQPVMEPGKMVGWIAPRRCGVRGKPLDYEYVRFG
jgi:hypothetical protein